MLADVREMIGVARDQVLRTLSDFRRRSLGGVLAVGEVGRPLLGVPVHPHYFGVPPCPAQTCSCPPRNRTVPGVTVDELMLDYSLLRPIWELLPERRQAGIRAGETDRLGAR